MYGFRADMYARESSYVFEKYMSLNHYILILYITFMDYAHYVVAAAKSNCQMKVT